MFKRGDIANNLFLICFTHMECILCGWGRIGYSDVSIHAPTRGATGTIRPPVVLSAVSIHAPTRGATVARSGAGCRVPVSIHAPTRGATPDGQACEPAFGFNPRTHTGCDPLGAIGRGVSIHAPTRGATPSFPDAWPQTKVSIHAPTRGATTT